MSDQSSSGPYSLRQPGAGSNGYTQVIQNFTDDWLASTLPALARPLAGFERQLRQQGLAERSKEELAFEMLVLGVLLREHGEQAVALPSLPAWLLARLVEAQDRFPLPGVEGPLKAARGWVHGLAAAEGAQPGEPMERAFGEPAARLAARLVNWLSAVGAGSQAERMGQWADYLDALDEQAAEAVLARCLLLADDFAESSQAALGAFTEGVEGFIEEFRGCEGARWRYDAGLVTRTRVEYHLGMLGTEILTRAYRPRYLAMPRKIVIVPDCLCAHSLRMLEPTPPDDPEAAGAPITRCKAERTRLGGKCQGCTPGCRVHQLTRLGEKRGFEVYILPDDLRGLGVGTCSQLEGVGVVGVSCALTNWDAGWQVASAGVPCQGVLLDYAGCRNHWHRTGLPTDVNLPRVLAALGTEQAAGGDIAAGGGKPAGGGK